MRPAAVRGLCYSVPDTLPIPEPMKYEPTDRERAQGWANLREHFPYRMSRLSPLAGRVVVFLGYFRTLGGIRARVGIMNPDGSTGERWDVFASHVVPL